MTTAKPDRQHTTLDNPLRSPPLLTTDIVHKRRCLTLLKMDHDIVSIDENPAEIGYVVSVTSQPPAFCARDRG
jgi:hypothetical protein